jgi:ankyrin repeat protein
MKHVLLTTIAAVVLVGCGESQQSAPAPESKPVEPVAEASQPAPPTVEAPDISISEAAWDGNIEAVKQHLAAGTDVNAKGRDGWTPLHAAAYYVHKEIGELLIGKGADVNAKNDDGWTPLHQASAGGHKETAEILLANGADVNAKNKVGLTPLHWAADVGHNDTAELLRKHGAKRGEELKAEGK